MPGRPPSPRRPCWPCSSCSPLDGALAKAEPKTLRYRILHAAVKLTRGARQRRLNVQVSWPWAGDIVTAWHRISTLPHPMTSAKRP